MAHKKNIPKKFKDKKYGFIEAFFDSFDRDKNIDIFPENIRFDRKEKDEEVIMITRKHWTAYITNISLAVFMPVIPIVLLITLANWENGVYGGTTVYISLFILSIIFAVNIIVTTVVQWYYNVSIITDKRILSLKVSSIFQHSYTEILWRKIQDVSHSSEGFLSAVFDIGSVYIDTAGEGIDLTLKFVPKPRDVQEVINNLVDLAHNGEL